MAIFIGIGLSPYVDLKYALFALIGYLCMANLVYITTSVKGEFKISYGKLGPTEVRVIAMISNTVVFFLGNPQIKIPYLDTMVSLYNLIVLGIIFLLVFFFTYTVITQAVKFERKDRKKWLKKLQKAEKA